ncbi:Cof-type HAD-IIB family hydrolase [Aquibacillus sp. 3ASR75-11]|uniref:Cof-type HAD-IIB family hydrolase n=1 Tax=Terrihalobacillus insolitus TaxID=2950438 RepID=A0A9X3WWQ2_9BACI|nr:Cof-type HAD-IIB family hydrolase [Terrihalobacillus insolitus]MDC3413707.1 Cof-type HAD-IIB family hydrolase [Terrihalobacillus insolitus]MDC3425566.1 Cof-type HAD-IIB family hydrolase [Terrihalobacillus insolitus]
MKKERHLIALDLDGTLLTDTKVIPDQTLQTIAKAKEQGHIVVIATGRPHRASSEYYDILGLDTPMVNFNGALIHHPSDNKWDVLHTPLPIRTARKIIQTCYELEVPNILAEIGNQVYLDRYDEELMKVLHVHRQNQPITVGSLKNELKTDPTSLLIYPHEKHVEQLRTTLSDEHASVIEHRKWAAPWNIIEIVRKGLNKAVGLKKIAHYYHIPVERIIAFGDEDNDFEMIEYAGVGVAMANAIDELKQIANHITVTNEENGVAVFLEDYLHLNVKV